MVMNEAFWVCLHRPSKMGAGCPDQNLGIRPSDYVIPHPGRL